VLATGDLSEGTHEVQITAVDGGGHSTVWKRGFLVDSTEVFGARPLGPGAVGADVTALQRALASRALYTPAPTGVYDVATTEAVAAYRKAHGLPQGTLADTGMLQLLFGSIRIDLSECRLYLYRDGQLAKVFPVAVGMAAYPTPTGSYEIVSKVVDPTWTPPNSPWAAGMSPVGPGPGNPLGTRWMGLSAPDVGIHGTYASSSIGSHASHGCIRMYLHDAEELFGLVSVGTPVEIVD